MLQVVEDGQRLLPGLPGLGQFAGGVAGVAEVGEDRLLPVAAVADFRAMRERALVAGGGFGEVAQLVLGVPEAVPGVGLPRRSPSFAVQGECLLAERAGLLVVAEEGVAPADVLSALASPPCGRGLVQAEGLPGRGRARRRSGPAGRAARQGSGGRWASPRRSPTRWYSSRARAR